MTNDAWEPMETAPKDGSSVRFLLSDGKAKVGKYGRHGQVSGWIRVVNGRTELFWPEPSGWKRIRPLVKPPKPEPAPKAPFVRKRRGSSVAQWWSVYVIGCPEMPHLKIGLSSDAGARLSGMAVGSPYELRLYLAMYGPPDDVMNVEREAHRALKDEGKHCRGEWFTVTPTEAISAITAAAARTGANLFTPMGALDMLGNAVLTGDAEVLLEGRIMRALAALAAA